MRRLVLCDIVSCDEMRLGGQGAVVVHALTDPSAVMRVVVGDAVVELTDCGEGRRQMSAVGLGVCRRRGGRRRGI